MGKENRKSWVYPSFRVDIVGSVELLESLRVFTEQQCRDILTECMRRVLILKTNHARTAPLKVPEGVIAQPNDTHPPAGCANFIITPAALEARRSDDSVIFSYHIREISYAFYGRERLGDCFCIVRRAAAAAADGGGGRRFVVVLRCDNVGQVDNAVTEWFYSSASLEKSNSNNLDRAARQAEQQVLSKVAKNLNRDQRGNTPVEYVNSEHAHYTNESVTPPTETGSQDSEIPQIPEMRHPNIYENLDAGQDELELSRSGYSRLEKPKDPQPAKVYTGTEETLRFEKIFHGAMRSEQAAHILRREGDFLLRLQTNDDGSSTLVLSAYSGGLRNIPLDESTMEDYRSIMHYLVHHLMRKIPVSVGGGSQNVLLLNPILRIQTAADTI